MSYLHRLLGSIAVAAVAAGLAAYSADEGRSQTPPATTPDRTSAQAPAATPTPDTTPPAKERRDDTELIKLQAFVDRYLQLGADSLSSARALEERHAMAAPTCVECQRSLDETAGILARGATTTGGKMHSNILRWSTSGDNGYTLTVTWGGSDITITEPGREPETLVVPDAAHELWTVSRGQTGEYLLEQIEPA